MSLARAVMVTAVLGIAGGCSGDVEASDDDLWQAYLDHTGFAENEAPSHRAEIVELTESMCDMDGLKLGTFIEMSNPDELALARVLTRLRCPGEESKFHRG